MAISFPTTAVPAVLSASRSPTVTFSSYTPLADDVVVLFSAVTTLVDNVTSGPPSGWVNILGGTGEVNSDAHTLAAMYHLVTPAEESAGTLTYTATNWWDANATGDTLGDVLRGVDPTNVLDHVSNALNTGDSVTPHVLPSLTGSELSNNSLVLRCVAKDGTGTYTTPAAHTQRATSNTNLGVWMGRHDAITTTGSNIADTNITPSAGDEYCSVSAAFTELAVTEPPPDVDTGIYEWVVVDGALIGRRTTYTWAGIVNREVT